MPVEPELVVKANSLVGFEALDRVMSVATKAGVAKMGFIGNEAYRLEPTPK